MSSTGLKIIDSQSPAHFWAQHPGNPKRVRRPDSKPLRLGRALHDLLQVNGAVPADWHLVPDGFNPKHTNVWSDHVAAYREAKADGKTILQVGEFRTVQNMAEAVSRHELAGALLTAGVAETTLIARDPKTGVFMRARPDVLPDIMEIIPDVKSAVNAAPDTYERAATNLGYFQSAAHYIDVIDLVFGEAPRRFVLIVVEKQPPFVVTIYHLDSDDLNQARMLNRRALNIFAECVRTGEWPAYNTPGKPIHPLIMHASLRGRINRMIELGELSYD